MSKNTKKKRSSDRYQTEKFKLIFENSPVAIWEEDLSTLLKLRLHLRERTVTNIRKYLSEHPDLLKKTFRGFKILDVNKAGLKLYGAKSKRELINNFGKTFTKDTLDVLVDEFSVLLSGSLNFQAEFKTKTLTGQTHDVLLKVSVPEQFKDTFSRVIVSLQDISEQKKLERHLRKLAQLDSQTKLYNHNTINQRLEAEFLRAKRYGSSLSCMMIDVDHFKVINDEFGHQKGDVIIKRVSTCLKNSMRKVDIVGRYGGDEFLVILPETKPTNAKIAAKRIEEIFKAKRFQVSKGVPVEIALSIGLSGYPSKGVKECKDLLAKADKAMYMAKKSGGNCIKMA